MANREDASAGDIGGRNTYIRYFPVQNQKGENFAMPGSHRGRHRRQEDLG